MHKEIALHMEIALPKYYYYYYCYYYYYYYQLSLFYLFFFKQLKETFEF